MQTPESFIEEMILERGISENTARPRLGYLKMFHAVLPRPLEECTTRDLKLVLHKMRGRYSPNTFGMMLYLIKKYLEWLDLPEIDLKRISQIRAPGKETTKTASDMLTGTEVQALIDATTNSRDRAMLSLLYEAGLRPVEMVRLTWRHVKQDRDGAVLSIDSPINKKTGKARYIRLINTAPLLAVWKKDTRGEIPGPVFVKLRGNPPPPITTNTIRKVIEKAVRDSGIEKKVHPYLFRHSRVTHMLEEEVPDTVIKLQHWGSLNSPMLATYGHISNEAVDRILLERAGIKRAPETRKRAGLHPIQCPSCEFVNPPGALFCMSCGWAFTEKGQDEQKKLKLEMISPEWLRELANDLEKERKGK